MPRQQNDAESYVFSGVTVHEKIGLAPAAAVEQRLERAPLDLGESLFVQRLGVSRFRAVRFYNDRF